MNKYETATVRSDASVIHSRKSMLYERFFTAFGWTYAIAGFIFLLIPEGWLPSFYDPVFMAAVAFISPIIVFLPKLLLKTDTPQKRRVVVRMRIIVMVSLLIGGIGELGLYQLYQVGLEYDKIAHFTVSMLLAFTCMETLTVWKNIPIRRLPWIVALIILTAGIFWETFEFASDELFETKTWGMYGQYVISDTLWDVFFNSFGTLAGILAATIKHSPSSHPKEFPRHGRRASGPRKSWRPCPQDR